MFKGVLRVAAHALLVCLLMVVGWSAWSFLSRGAVVWVEGKCNSKLGRLVVHKATVGWGGADGQKEEEDKATLEEGKDTRTLYLSCAREAVRVAFCVSSLYTLTQPPSTQRQPPPHSFVPRSRWRRLPLQRGSLCQF